MNRITVAMYATCNSTINKKHKKNYEKVFCIFRNNFICSDPV